jgi:carbonic anhydrase
MEIASAACERTRLDAGQMDLAQQCAYCERESINVSLANLLTFPWIKDAVSRRALQLHGWYYDMEQSAMSTWKLRYQITDYTKLQ